jgi:hypothetical protein
VYFRKLLIGNLQRIFPVQFHVSKRMGKCGCSQKKRLISIISVEMYTGWKEHTRSVAKGF